MAHICALLIVILGGFSKLVVSLSICIRFKGLAFAQKTHEGLGIGYILQKFASLKEGVGEIFPNIGWEIVSARRFK